MTPPNTPPEKRPDRHYNFGRMNMVFAVSALALLAVTLWMAFADYAQPWKRLQAEFRSLERQKLVKEAEAERGRLNQTEIAQLQKDIAAQEASLKADKGEIEALEDKIRDLTSQRDSADADWRAAKAKVDEHRFLYDNALQAAGAAGPGGAQEAGKGLDAARTTLRDEKKRLEEAEAQRSAVLAQLAEKRAAVTAAEARLKALNEGLDNIETRIAKLNKGVDYFVLNAPLMDFILPSLKVEQVILPGLVHNINFANIDRVDRCMTCHVAANRPGFEDDPATTDVAEWKEPFRSHPQLDLFVGDGSPHPYTRFGCTVCHGGLDRATNFARAGHSPTSEEQKKEWEKKYGWEKQPFLEYPILPSGLAEAGCATCHAGDVWTAKSETQDVGRELVSHMGCAGCHTINLPAYQGLRKAGPSLDRIAGKTNPGWAYKWIEAPRDFHPTTYMPHFFFQENTETPENKGRQRAEMAAIVSYLWAKSDKPVYDDAVVPAGNAAAGKQIFENVGCAGCHILDGKAKRDDFYPVVNRLHGPNLVRTGSKVGRGWLYSWIRNPKQYYPETNMPDLRLTDQEAADVVAYLTGSRDPKFENVRIPPVDGKLRDGLLREYLQNVNTIERSQAKLASMSEQDKNVYLGEQTIAKYGCYGCHDIPGFENAKPIGTELTQEGSKPVHQFDFGHVHDVPHTRHDWIRTKLLRPRIWDEGKEEVKDYNELLKMPSFGMSEREAQAVLSNVAGFTKETAIATRRAGGNARAASLAEGRKLITRFNCQGCHLVEGHGQAIKSMIGDDQAKLPPNLASEGARVQGDWLFAYLHDPSRVSMRPWLTVRMPTFGFTDTQANTVISYFTSREARSPFTSEPPLPDARSLAVGGIVFNALQCARCHPSGPVVAGGASADLAPSLLLAHDRLRYDWVPDWIKNPQGWVPGTRMPNFFNETKPGEFTSSVALMFAAPTYAAQRQQMLQYFGSEAEMNAYLSDTDKVTAAMRDHIWSLSRGGRPASLATTPGGTNPAAGAAGAAGGR